MNKQTNILAILAMILQILLSALGSTEEASPETETPPEHRAPHTAAARAAKRERKAKRKAAKQASKKKAKRSKPIGVLATEGASADPEKAVRTVCGSGRTRGCGGHFLRLRSEGKRCPDCKTKRGAKRAQRQDTGPKIRAQKPQHDPRAALQRLLGGGQLDPQSLATLAAALADDHAENASQEIPSADDDPAQVSDFATGFPGDRLENGNGICTLCNEEYRPRVAHQKRCSPECRKAANTRRMQQDRANGEEYEEYEEGSEPQAVNLGSWLSKLGALGWLLLAGMTGLA